MGNPVKLVDPSGLDIWVVINNNGALFGTHAGFYTNTDGRNIYDPAGTFAQDTRGTGDLIWGDDANLEKYIEYQRAEGPDVDVYHFPTTQDQDMEILENIEREGTCRIAGCASCTSDVLRGVGPFKDLEHYNFPSFLGARMQQLHRQYGSVGTGGGGW